ncbi:MULTISPECIES: hypothetical protein [unclassified Pseudoxanthomonas]|uniref:hypothetical protein n=1 Tax=unclassified Pseudoxanthomonas TaxID=2645906 RepID=UPI0011142986|nr:MULTISPECIES: hypothetical protein [unclassified Pseudoxanthomonas]
MAVSNGAEEARGKNASKTEGLALERRLIREERDDAASRPERRASESVKQDFATAKDARIPHPLIPR